MTRAHLLALPNVQTTRKYGLDGFCSATIRFAKLLKQMGVHVTLYASEENEAPCDELVTVITKEEQKVLLDGIEYQYAALFNRACALWALGNNRSIIEIKKRKQPRDILLTIGGTSQQPIADAIPEMMCVEYFIGYISSFAKYRVYASHYWRGMTHGMQGMEDGRFFDDVIHGFYEPSEFPFRKKPEDYAVYVGRLTPKKGLEIACSACQKAGVKLKVVGHGDPALVTHGAEYLGALPDDEKNDVVSRAVALLAPTTYVEPLGNTVVEAQLSGVPAITTDFGGFVETVESAETGFRCNYMGEFVRALQNAHYFNREYIRDRAMNMFTMESAIPRYKKYFDRLNLLWEDGFYSLK